MRPSPTLNSVTAAAYSSPVRECPAGFSVILFIIQPHLTSAIQEAWNIQLVISSPPGVCAVWMQPRSGRPIVNLDKIAMPLTVLAPPVRLSVPRQRQNIRNIRNRLHGRRFACFACFGLMGGREVAQPLFLKVGPRVAARRSTISSDGLGLDPVSP
jgi:hypothetical protein